MRPYTAELDALLKGPVVSYGCRVEAWRNGVLLGTAPIESGSITWKSGVIETAEQKLGVPADREWKPTGPVHPLAPYGQRLRTMATITGPGPHGAVYEIPLGWSQITKSPTSNGTVDVTARDLGVVIERARTTVPYQLGYPGRPAGQSSTAVAAVADLLTAVCPFWPRPDLPTAYMPQLFVSRDRYAGLQEILTAWPAVARFDEAGVLDIRRAPSAGRLDPVMSFTDGRAGTIVEISTEPVESNAYNACVVLWTDSHGRPRRTGEWVRSGPMAWPSNNGITSVYGYNPGFYASPLIHNEAQALAAAKATLTRWQRGTAGSFKISAAPDPRLQVGDPITVTAGDVSGVGVVSEVTLPLTADGGSMSVGGELA